MKHRGFTLVEILLALSITSLIAMTVASMLFGVGAAVDRGGTSRARLAARDVASNRLDNQIRNGGRVLAAGTDWIVLWTSDANANNKPNLAEIRRVEFDSAGHQLRSYAAPATLSESNNTAYNFDADFSSITSNLKGSANFVETPVMPDIQGLALTVPTPLNTAKLIHYTLTLSDDQGNFTVRGAVALHSIVPTGN